MTVVISMLRGINVLGCNKIKMDELRDLYGVIGLRDAQTFIQSGNVVFRTGAKHLGRLAKQIEGEIERKFGFRPSVILRTTAELRDVIARNPFAGRRELDGSKFLITFFAAAPSPESHELVLKIKDGPEEIRIDGREMYVYFPDGIGPSKIRSALEKALKKAGTGRNWNTVTKLLEMAETLEGSR